MGIAALDYRKNGGLSINGIIEDYYVYAGENINAGDFVEFVNGIASKTTETSVDTEISATEGYGYIISACKLAENKAFIAHANSATDNTRQLYGVVCTINGTKITYGTDTKLSNIGYTGTAFSVVSLEEDKVFIAHRYYSSFQVYGMVCTISVTTITIGAYTLLDETTTSGACPISAVKLTSDKVFTAYCYGSGGSLYVIVCTISGTTITKGTKTAINSNSNTGKSISVVCLESGKVFVAHDRTSRQYLNGIVCTISGTTITKGTDTKIHEASKAGSEISAVKISDTSVFIAILFPKQMLP